MAFKNIILAAFCVCFIASSPTYAGFEWKPAAPAPAPEPVYMPKYPAPPVQKIETPEIAPKAAPTYERAVEEQPVVIERQSPPQQETPQASQTQAPQKQEMYTGEVVHGFGSDLPLAYALSQVVPAHYGYSFGPGVNPGYRVSWNGGKPWQEVARDMIAPLNLSLEIQGNTLIIEQKGAPRVQRQSRATQAQPAPAKPAPTPAQELAAVEKPAIKTIPKLVKTNVRRTNIVDPGPVETTQPIQLMADESRAKNSAKFENNYAYRDAAPLSASHVWKAKQGDSLRNTLGRWSNQVAVGVVWNASHDYEVDSNVVLNGTYVEAIETLLATAVKENDNLSHDVVMHEGSDVAKTLIIKDRS